MQLGAEQWGCAQPAPASLSRSLGTQMGPARGGGTALTRGPSREAPGFPDEGAASGTAGQATGGVWGTNLLDRVLGWKSVLVEQRVGSPWQLVGKSCNSRAGST